VHRVWMRVGPELTNARRLVAWFHEWHLAVWALAALGISGLAATGNPLPLVVDDVALWQRFADQLGDYHSQGKTPPLVELRSQLVSRKKAVINLGRPARRELPPAEAYQRYSASVVALGSVYKCNRCPHWHTGGTGTGFVDDTDGG